MFQREVGHTCCKNCRKPKVSRTCGNMVAMKVETAGLVETTLSAMSFGAIHSVWVLAGIMGIIVGESS